MEIIKYNAYKADDEKNNTKIPEPDEKIEDDDDIIEDEKNEKINSFNDFLNEEGIATASNSNGMGAIVAPTVSAIPGDVSGSIKGSGDIAAKAFKPADKLYNPKVKSFKKRKKMITSFSDFKK